MSSIHKANRPPRRQHRQRGAALIVMLVVVVMGAATVLVGSLSTTRMQTARQGTTAAALAQAKEALIGKAITYSDYPGSLPCPDTNDDGDSDAGGSGECPQYIGRLPWKTLGIPDLRDAAGERLWYTLSRNVRRYDSVRPLNSDTAGTLNITGDYTASNLVAIVFSPGMVVNNKSRSDSLSLCTTTSTTIKESRCAINYLEGSNANPSPGAAPNTNYQHEFQSDSFNDQLIVIFYQQLLPLVEKRIAREAKNCLDNYAADPNYKYPWAVPVSTPTAFSPLIMGEYNTLFGRLPTRPSVQTESTPAIITTMQSKFDELWTALAVFAASKTSANLTAMQTKASAAKSAADTVKDFYNGTQLENPASNLKNAADDAKDDLNTSSSDADISTVQQAIINAANNFTNEMSAVFSQAPGMANTWPASCTLFSSAYWNDWKDLVFYQLANGFEPGSAASCGNCLSIEGSAHNLAGSGSYRATVIVAGKKLTANRIATNISDYLEADNLLPKDDTSQPYKTYRATDAEYQTTNDLVLCLDGKMNCK